MTGLVVGYDCAYVSSNRIWLYDYGLLRWDIDKSDRLMRMMHDRKDDALFHGNWCRYTSARVLMLVGKWVH